MKTTDWLAIGIALLFVVAILNLIFAFRSHAPRNVRKAVRTYELDSAYKRGYNQGYQDGVEDKKSYLGRAKLG